MKHYNIFYFSFHLFYIFRPIKQNNGFELQIVTEQPQWSEAGGFPDEGGKTPAVKDPIYPVMGISICTM